MSFFLRKKKFKEEPGWERLFLFATVPRHGVSKYSRMVFCACVGDGGRVGDANQGSGAVSRFCFVLFFFLDLTDVVD